MARAPESGDIAFVIHSWPEASAVYDARAGATHLLDGRLASRLGDLLEAVSAPGNNIAPLSERTIAIRGAEMEAAVRDILRDGSPS
jgi:hypothetical protein